MSDALEMSVLAPEQQEPLTAVVILPQWALVYGAGVLLLNVALLFLSRSKSVMDPLMEAAMKVAPGAQAQALAVATLAALLTVGAYALMLLPVLALRSEAKYSYVRLSAALGLRRFRLGQTVGLSVLMLVGMFAVTAAYVSVMGLLGVSIEGNTADLVSGFRTGPVEIAIAFLLVGIVAPLVEEVTFRGIVFPSLREAWGTTPALLASGAMFGVLHLQLTIALPLALIGMALALIFLRTRSLWSAIIAHCLYNTVSLALAFVLAPLTS